MSHPTMIGPEAVSAPLERVGSSDIATISIMRGRKTERTIRIGTNYVHAFITHADGTLTDLGVSENLLTNIGRDVGHGWIGGFIPAGGAGSPNTAVNATSITATAPSPWTNPAASKAVVRGGTRFDLLKTDHAVKSTAVPTAATPPSSRTHTCPSSATSSRCLPTSPSTTSSASATSSSSSASAKPSSPSAAHGSSGHA